MKMLGSTLRTSRSTMVGTLATLSVASISLTDMAKAQTVAVDAALLQQLQQLIEQQETRLQQQSDQLQQQSDQLNTQMRTIQALKGRLDQLEQTSTEAQTIASEAQSAAQQAIDTAQGARRGEERLITSGSDRIKLAISGQLNRAMNVVDDGDETDVFHVDNDVSNSRLRFVGTADVTDETTLGTVVEIAFSPNNSFDVSQDDQSTDDFIDVRKVEALARNDAYGQLLFGKGAAAADDTAEYDLSLVAGPIMYSGVSDVVGGIQLVNENDSSLSGVTLGDAFFNFDGNRQDRVRYDSPVVGPGVQLSVSAGSDERYDLAVTWGGDYGDWTGVDIGPFTTLGAISIRDPNEAEPDWRVAGSFSALHNPTGLGLTVSAGTDEVDGGDNPYNLYAKLSWDTAFFDFGPTGFGIDATYNENITAQDDEGTSFGVAAVQLIEDYGTELYAAFRYFDLDREGDPDFEEIFVGTVGTRVKF